MSSSEQELSQPSDDDITADQHMSESSDDLIGLQGPTPPKLRRRAVASTTKSGKTDKGAKKPSGKVSKAPKLKPEPKSSKKRKAVEEEKAIEDVILSIPEADSGANSRVTLPTNTSFEDALDEIYQTIGCASVVRKPILSYKFSTAGKNDPNISLRSDKDWIGCLADAETLANKKTTKKGPITVNIQIPELYLASLKGRKGSAAASKVKTKARGKMVLMDLDNEDDEDEEEVEGMREAEAECLEKLEKALKRCAKCGPEKNCKIDKAGNHCQLTFQQCRAWALALVSSY